MSKIDNFTYTATLIPDHNVKTIIALVKATINIDKLDDMAYSFKELKHLFLEIGFASDLIIEPTMYGLTVSMTEEMSLTDFFNSFEDVEEEYGISIRNGEIGLLSPAINTKLKPTDHFRGYEEVDE